MTLTETARKYPGSLIGKAYALAEKAHAGQKRKGGEPYLSHALSTGEKLAEWGMDEATVAAGLLHDVAEDTRCDLEEIRKKFGDEVTFLVDGVTKLGKIKYRDAERKAENIRKMIVAVSQDLRVIFIKIADRLHNMKTLSALPPQKQKRIALETYEIYAPIAYRLGMQSVSGELEDLAFPYLSPKEYKWLTLEVKDEYHKREEYLKNIKPAVQGALREAGIRPLFIDFRAKRYSSLYKKLKRYDMDFEKIYDLVAFRIIVKDISDCYAALGLIHKLWPPLPGRIKDYIAMPKPNGYKSLHTTVIGPDNKMIEFQIRTEEMHKEAELGIAAHWAYEEQKGFKHYFTRRAPRPALEDIAWVRQLRRWLEAHGRASEKPEEFLRTMKIDFFKDRIFVISPKGDVFDLPAGATPVDYAYHVHTEVGNACGGAKVNGAFVPLDHELQSGDVVEIVTQKGKRPSEDWLSFVKTSIAKNHIRAALREKERTLRGPRLPKKTELRMVVEDRIGLIKDISSLIAGAHINIIGFTVANRGGSRFPMNKIEIATTDKKKVEKLVLRLKKIKEVKEISYRIL